GAQRENSMGTERKDAPRQGDLDLELDGPSLFTARDDDFPDDEPAQRITEDKDLPPVEEGLVSSVISRSEGGFKGPALLQNILASGLRFGEMDIFACHGCMAGNVEALFSLAMSVYPGVFDAEEADLFVPRAVAFFPGLPGPRPPQQAFAAWLASAPELADGPDVVRQ
ncbi:cell division protein ZipA, partial [Pseudomonas syringae]